jgi:hypothetical protein
MNNSPQINYELSMLSENVEHPHNSQETILSINPSINYEDSSRNPTRIWEILTSFVDNTDIARSEHELDSVRNQFLPFQMEQTSNFILRTPPLTFSPQVSSILSKFLII